MDEQAGGRRPVRGSPGRHELRPAGGRAPVVVGVDGSAAALDAVEWAAAEAAARHCPLHVVHVLTWPVVIDPAGIVAGASLYAHQAAAEQVVDEAVVRARVVASDVRVVPRLVTGSAGPVLVEQAVDAGLLVLGHGSRRSSRRLRRSINVRVITQATCPVAVVKPFRIMSTAPAAAWVVVGVDGSAHSAAAVGFAYQAAAQRGIGLRAIHPWSPRGVVDHRGVATDVADAEKAERRVLHQALTGWRSKFPEVPVEARLVRDSSGRALLNGSAGAALTVVGSNKHDPVGGRMPEGVIQTLIRNARSPVAVIHPRTMTVPQGHRSVRPV